MVSRLLRLATRVTRILASANISICMLAVSAPLAFAQQYPEKPIRIIVGFGQGGPTDVVARVLADQLSQKFTQRVYVENRPGASGNIATQALASADSDGYTFMVGATPFAINHSLFPNLPVKFGTDVAAVRSIGATTNVLVVNPRSNLKSLSEFIRFAKVGGPESVSYITLGQGSSSHLAGVEFDRLAGTKMLPVAYRGSGEALQDVVAGQVMAWFAPIPSVGELVKSGKLNALGVTGPRRVSELPDVPTLDEAGLKGFDVRLWVGLFARTGIPKERLEMFESTLSNAMETETYTSTLSAQGIEPMKMTSSEFSSFVSSEIARWKVVVESLR